jgi:hypothetical protein
MDVPANTPPWAKKLIIETVYLVESTDFEQFTLWEKFALTAKKKGNQEARYPSTDALRVSWEQGRGWSVVGYFTSEPVVISISLNKLNEKQVAFWHMTSTVRHVDIAKKLLNEVFGDIPRTDAQNFHLVLDELKK